MHAVRTLLEGVVDYAGLFPPAKLDMAPTVRNYDAYRRGADVWMLGRVVVPVARLSEFEGTAESLLPRVAEPGNDETWPISALTAAAGDPQLVKDLDRVATFNERHAAIGAGSAVIDCIETHAASAADVDRALDLVGEDLFPYFEFPHGADPRGLIAALAGLDAGAKIRTGGLTAAAHPSPEAVAAFLVACARAETPFKATAGLHHPFRHLDASLGCRQHGFINVFLGAALAWHDRIDEPTLSELLADESPASFQAGGDSLAWRSLRLTAAELRGARDAFAHSFGSCSFVEPLDDLRSLRWLSAPAALTP